MFMNCTHVLCTGCFCESIVNKPNCPLCRARVEDQETRSSVKYLIQTDKYVIVTSQIFYSFTLNYIEFNLLKNHFILKYENNKTYTANDMGNILSHLKGVPEIYNIFLKMITISKKSFVKNTDEFKDCVNRYQYKFNFY